MWINGQSVKYGPEEGWDGELIGMRAMAPISEAAADLLDLEIDEELEDEIAIDAIYEDIHFDDALDFYQPEDDYTDHYLDSDTLDVDIPNYNTED